VIQAPAGDRSAARGGSAIPGNRVGGFPMRHKGRLGPAQCGATSYAVHRAHHLKSRNSRTQFRHAKSHENTVPPLDRKGRSNSRDEVTRTMPSVWRTQGSLINIFHVYTLEVPYINCVLDTNLTINAEDRTWAPLT
jgi:hypothetical protein